MRGSRWVVGGSTLLRIGRASWVACSRSPLRFGAGWNEVSVGTHSAAPTPCCSMIVEWSGSVVVVDGRVGPWLGRRERRQRRERDPAIGRRFQLAPKLVARRCAASAQPAWPHATTRSQLERWGTGRRSGRSRRWAQSVPGGRRCRCSARLRVPPGGAATASGRTSSSEPCRHDRDLRRDVAAGSIPCEEWSIRSKLERAVRAEARVGFAGRNARLRPAGHGATGPSTSG